MTAKRRAKKRRHDDESAAGPPAHASTSGPDHERTGSGTHALLQMQAERGNAAVQRLVTGGRQLQRQLEDDEEQQPAAEEDIYEDLDADPQLSLIRTMWETGVLKPLESAHEKVQAGDKESLQAALSDVLAARDFHYSVKETIKTKFPDVEPEWAANHNGIQLVMSSLATQVGQKVSVESIDSFLESTRSDVANFPALLGS